MDMRLVKNIIKRFLFTFDFLMIGFFLPRLFDKVKQVHLSFDDVNFLCNGGSLLINRDFASLIGSLNVPMDIFLMQENSNCTVHLDSIDNVKWNYHLPNLYDDYKIHPTTVYARFHYFRASSNEVRTFYHYGGRVLLTCNDNMRLSYDLTRDECNLVNKAHSIKKNGITYLKTDVRLEKMLLPQLLKLRDNSFMVIFGHEWGGHMYNKRLKLIIQFLKSKNVHFIN